jgi:hypothetical protein
MEKKNNNEIDPCELMSDDPCDLMSEEEVALEKQMYLDQLMAKKQSLELSNQSIIELAYITKDLIEPFIKDRTKLTFEEANCYLAGYYLCKRFLKLVDKEYLACHESLYDFYYRKDNKELSNDWDRLHWEKRGNDK